MRREVIFNWVATVFVAVLVIIDVALFLLWEFRILPEPILFIALVPYVLFGFASLAFPLFLQQQRGLFDPSIPAVLDGAIKLFFVVLLANFLANVLVRRFKFGYFVGALITLFIAGIILIVGFLSFFSSR